MAGPHPVVKLSDLADLHLEELSVGYQQLRVSRKNRLGTSAVLKCESASISELFGYLLARFLGVRIARFQGVWFDRRLRLRPSMEIPRYHLGVLVEFLSDIRPLSLAEVAQRDRRLAAKILAFCVFDRFEWPCAFASDSSVCILDLERIGPVMIAEEFTCTPSQIVIQNLEARENQYVAGSLSAFHEVYNEASTLHIADELLEALGEMGSTREDLFLSGLSIQGHPYSGLLSSFFQSAVSSRQSVICSPRGIRAWPAIDWKKHLK